MSTTPAGIPSLDRIAQVKLPVSDLAVSVAWYRRLLDLRLWVEIVEDDVLVGAGLIDPRGRFNGIHPTPAGELLDVPDPDGTVLRFYHFTDPTDGLTGAQFRNGQHPGNDHTPRLR